MVKDMMKNPGEEISMLMDGEIDEHGRARVIHKLKDDDRMKSCWEHYHLISEALRNNLPEIIYPDLADRLTNLLNKESPHRNTQSPSAEAMPRHRSITGFALAASLAVIAVVGLLQINQQNGGIPDQQLATVQEMVDVPQATNSATIVPAQAVIPARTVASIPTQTVASLPLTNRSIDVRMPQQPDSDPQSVEPRLYDYLLHHNEYAVTAPVQGAMLPYARMVGYASDE